MKTTILKPALILTGIMLLQGCSMEQLARFNASCPYPSLPDCGMTRSERAEQAERWSDYDAEKAAWDYCVSQGGDCGYPPPIPY